MNIYYSLSGAAVHSRWQWHSSCQSRWGSSRRLYGDMSGRFDSRISDVASNFALCDYSTTGCASSGSFTTSVHRRRSAAAAHDAVNNCRSQKQKRVHHQE